MARKVKASALAAVATDGADFLHGSNKLLSPDVLDGGLGDDMLKSYIGDDALIGGAGADTFIFDWYDSNAGADFGVDRIEDFNAAEGDKIDLSHATHYSEADMAVAVSRAVNASDVTLTPEAGSGTHIHVEVVAGDPTWDIDIVDVLGTVTLADFIFAA